MRRAPSPVPASAAPLLAALALGCAVDEASAPTDTAITPTAWDPDLSEAGAAEPVDAAALEEGLAEVLVYLGRQDPLLHHEAWTEMFWGNAETTSCPVLMEHNNQDYWDDDCTTSRGARFDGWTLNFRQGGWTEGEMTVLQYNWLSGHAYIVDPTGRRIENYGDVELLLGEAEDWDYYGGFVFGDFDYTDPVAADTWIAEPITGELYYAYYDHGSWQSAWLEGGVTSFSGPVLAARFEDVAIDDAPGSCALEPSGRVRLRDREGLWYDVDFGATDGADAACDGCGDAALDGDAIGAVCADWTPFVAWRGWPWAL